jgi:signal transduction histidine kinase
VLRKWDQEFLNNLATISGSKVDLRLPSDTVINRVDNTIHTPLNLAGYNGIIVSQIVFTRVLSLNFNVMQNIMIILLIFVFAALVASNYIARRIINNPLKLVSQILKFPGIRSIDSLKKSPAEFGRIGLLFEEFFLQKAEKERNAIALLAERKIKEATQKRQMELEIKNKELEQFAFIASHDLQEPLRTVSNYMQVFEEDYLPLLDDKAIKYLHSVNAATQRMSILIKSILTFSRLGKNARLASVNFKMLITKVISNLDTLIKTSNAVIEVTDMPILNVYEEEMQELFSNLMMNAIKFQPKGNQPRIHIHSKFTNNLWEFSVTDNGIGIAPAYHDQVFNIFKRLNANKEEYPGLGIGLANCRKIVQLHQGDIRVESKPGHGSTFYFTIPNLKT